MAIKALWLATWLIFSISWTPVSSLQYCQVDPVRQTDYCLALNIVHNEATRSDDYYMSVSIGFPESKYGWVALGAGTYIMHRSLMFVMYPGTQYKDLVVGIRSTEYHDEPRLPGDAPNLTVTRTAFQDGYHSASFICHSCNRWDGAALQSDSSSMAWIWAAEPFQPPNSDDPNKSLHRHEYYGDFFMDMASGKSTEFAFPTVTQERVSINAGAKRLNSKKKISSASLITLHGLVLGFVFSICYPAGVLSLLLNVKWHYLIQIGTTAIAFLGILIALYRELSLSGLSSLLRPHQAAGTAIGVMMGCQIFLGWYNHVRYLETRLPSSLGNVHRWLGRWLYIAGVANVLLGISAAGLSRGLAVAWCLLVATQVIAYLWLRTVRARREATMDEKREHEYFAIASDEETLEGDE